MPAKPETMIADADLPTWTRGLMALAGIVLLVGPVTAVLLLNR